MPISGPHFHPLAVNLRRKHLPSTILEPTQRILYLYFDPETGDLNPVLFRGFLRKGRHHWSLDRSDESGKQKILFDPEEWRARSDAWEFGGFDLLADERVYRPVYRPRSHSHLGRGSEIEPRFQRPTRVKRNRRNKKLTHPFGHCRRS